MWIGVPTMLAFIIASGLQKPKSVSFARCSELSSTFFSLMSLWTKPCWCKNLKPLATSTQVLSRSSAVRSASFKAWEFSSNDTNFSKKVETFFAKLKSCTNLVLVSPWSAKRQLAGHRLGIAGFWCLSRHLEVWRWTRYPGDISCGRIRRLNRTNSALREARLISRTIFAFDRRTCPNDDSRRQFRIDLKFVF